MAGKFVSMRNLKFLLYEVFDTVALTRNPYYSQHNQKSFDLVLDASMKLAQKMLFPLFEEMDRKAPYLEDGQVKVHPAVRAIMKEFGEGGWIGATFPEAWDGEQLPGILHCACQLIKSSANYSAGVYAGLTAGAARLIHSFAAEHLKTTYLPNMMAGKWQGTMALTEPQAGSSLSDITTTAYPTDKGHYLLKGQKVFISAGDHDGVDNVVHMLLARIDGAPQGVKGISLFLVPKKRPDEKGRLVPNDVSVSQVFHKMGYRGAPITELSFGDKDDCRGFLVGEPNRGLMHMFQMMNEARIGVGLGAAAIASAAYYAALEYCQTRPQGRKVGAKDPSAPQIPIIEHADVRRMLLFQRAVVEGSEGLLMQCALYEDFLRTTPPEEHLKYELLLELLTPMAKSYPSEMGILSTSQAIQCLGGYGYCEDFPVEQHFRDCRIHPIHEGTTGIQGMDLLGRKVVMKEGRALALFLEEARNNIAEARSVAGLEALSQKLEEALQTLEQVTGHLVGLIGKRGVEIFLADATLYLEMFGIIAVAWQWLLQAAVAQKALQGKPKTTDLPFYRGKLVTARYFFAYELPKIKGLYQRLTDTDALTVEMDSSYFND
ncbi:MAG: acyl-CoA dehydrogenase [Desulfobacteraceae bacterium]|nr:MAG: acyl-CoA dehydrogenase [Desulfobacteraceae bacterium]